MELFVLGAMVVVWALGFTAGALCMQTAYVKRQIRIKRWYK